MEQQYCDPYLDIIDVEETRTRNISGNLNPINGTLRVLAMLKIFNLKKGTEKIIAIGKKV